MVDFNKKLREERKKPIDDKVPYDLPLDTEEDMRKSIRVLLEIIRDMNMEIELLKKKDAKDDTIKP